MTRSRRPIRRQGVVYGSPAVRGQADEAGSIIGRLVGILVIAAAAALLVVGSLAFIGGGGEGPGPTASLLAGGSTTPTPAPSPTASPTAPTPSPTASPTESVPVETATPSPTATPFELAVREGPGFVTFGTNSNRRLRITDARTSFGLQERIVSSAHLTGPANSVDLRIEVRKLDQAAGTDELVREYEVRPQVTGASIFLRRFRPNRALDGPGIYVMRYLRGSELMAEGFFEVRP